MAGVTSGLSSLSSAAHMKLRNPTSGPSVPQVRSAKNNYSGLEHATIFLLLQQEKIEELAILVINRLG